MPKESADLDVGNTNSPRCSPKVWITSLNSHSARFQSRTIYCFSFNASRNRKVPSQMGQTLTVDLISRLALHWGHLTLWNFAFLE